MPSRWHGHGFGLDLDGGFAVVGCAQTRQRGPRRVRLDQVAAEQVLAAFGTTAKVVLAEQRDARRRRVVALEAHERNGFLLTNRRGGRFLISRQADRVWCAPALSTDWRWQRYLVGQVLPLVATLRGLEPLHASVVAIAGRAIAILGPSGSGKSSLAAELILLGASFMADDVAVVEPTPAGLRVHAGLGLMSLRAATAERLGHDLVTCLGRPVGRDRREVRLSLDCDEPARPLVACYFLRQPRGSSRLQLVASPADPRLVLGSSFISAIRSRERLTRQFDVAATLSSSVRQVQVRLPAVENFSAAARRVVSDVERTFGPGG